MSVDNQDLNISVTFRHTESTDAIRTYAEEKLTHCISKYVHSNADVSVILCVEKRDHIAEVILHSKGFDVTAKASTEDLYTAIDKMTSALDAQLRKQKEKSVEHHKHQNVPPLR